MTLVFLEINCILLVFFNVVCILSLLCSTIQHIIETVILTLCLFLGSLLHPPLHHWLAQHSGVLDQGGGYAQ